MFHVKAVVDLFLVQHAKGRSTRVGSRSVWYCIAPIDSVDVEVVVARCVEDIDRVFADSIPRLLSCSEEIVELGGGTETQHLSNHPLVHPLPRCLPSAASRSALIRTSSITHVSN